MKNFYIAAGAALLGASLAQAADVKPTLQLPEISIAEAMATQTAPVRAPKANAAEFPQTIITEQPAGTSLKYSRDGQGYWLYYGAYYMFTSQTDQMGQIVEGEDGTVYIKNPIFGLTYDAYLKGVREGDKIRVDLPQAIYQETSQETKEPVLFYGQILDAEFDDEGNRYFVPAEEQTLYYTVDGNKMSIDLGYDHTKLEDGNYPYPDRILGLTTAENQYAYFGDCWQEWTRLDQEMMTVPEGLETETWNFFHNGLVSEVQIGFDGDYMYVLNAYPTIPDATLRGKVEGDKVTFESGLYIADYVSYYIYQMIGYINGYEDYSLVDKLEMTYDRDNHVIYVDDPNYMILMNTSLNRIYAATNFANPMFKLPGAVTDPTPMTPQFDDFIDYYDSYGYAWFSFDIYNYNSNDEVFNPDNMWYNMLFDGYVETLSTEDYWLEEDITDIPFNGTIPGDIIVKDQNRKVCIYAQGLDTIGVQLFHEYDGKVYGSGVLTYNIATGEVSTTEGGEVGVGSMEAAGQSMTYDLSGRIVRNPGNGIFITRTVNADGSVAVKKEIRR